MPQTLPDQTLTDLIRSLPSTPTTVPDIPMVWRHQDSGATLADGAAITGADAVTLLHSEGWRQISGPHAGVLAGWSPAGLWIVYVAEHPEPADLHEAASVLESDLLALGMGDEPAAALVHAVRAAIDDGNPGAQLRQWLAAWARA
jgi:hypothetical protein